MASRSRAAVQFLAAACLAGALSACGHGAGDAVAPHSDTTKAAPPPLPLPRVIDLRFKGVGDLSSSVGLLHTDILAHQGGGALWQQFDSAAGSPLNLGNGTCSATDCAWFLFVFALPTDLARIATAYRAGVMSELPRFATTGPTDTVITSLDLEPAVGVFALSEFATSRSGGYHLTQRRVPLGELQAAASDEGAANRVITAIAFDSGQVRFLSYSWDHDTGQGYDVRVLQATLSTAGTVAQSLAAEGYVVTALGGDPADEFVLVGTRAHGDTQPRSLLINPDLRTNLSGYAVVGYLDDALAGGATTLILER